MISLQKKNFIISIGIFLFLGVFVFIFWENDTEQKSEEIILKNKSIESSSNFSNNEKNDSKKDLERINYLSKIPFDKWIESWAIISGPESATDLMIYAGINDTLHIISGDYYNNKRCELRYAFYNGENWSDEKIPFYSNFYGEEADIVVDKKNNPHVVFIDDANVKLYYAVKKNNVWDVELVGATESFVLDAGIDLDDFGNPHIVYDTCAAGEDYDYDSKPSRGRCALWYTYKKGAEWEVEEIINKEIKVRSIAVDSENNIHTTFATENNEKGIYYAIRKNEKWEVEKVDDEWMMGSDVGIDIDSKNNPHLIYKKNNGNVEYAIKKNNFWNIETLNNVKGEEEAMRIFIDSDDFIHIYYGEDNPNSDNLRAFYHYYNGTWDQELLDDCGGEGDISVNKDKVVYICFGSAPDENEEDVDYVKCIWKRVK